MLNVGLLWRWNISGLLVNFSTATASRGRSVPLNSSYFKRSSPASWSSAARWPWDYCINIRHANREKTHGNQENIFISMTAHTQHLGGEKYCKVKKTPGNREKSRQPNQTETTHQNTETSCRYRTCMQMWKSTEYTDTMQAVQTMRGGVHFSEASVSLISWFGYHVELSAVCSR